MNTKITTQTEQTPSRKEGINTSTLKKGKTFSNLKQLSYAIGTPLPKGRVSTAEYQKMYSLWNKFFEWENIPNSKQIVITKVYRKPREENNYNKKKENKNTDEIFSSSRAIYQNDLCKLVIHELIKNKKHDLRLTYPDLINLLELKHNLIEDIEYGENERIEDALIKGKKLYLAYKRIIKSSLIYLEKNNVILYKEEESIKRTDGTIKRANKEETETIKKWKVSAYQSSLKHKTKFTTEFANLVHKHGDNWEGVYSYIRIKLIDDRYLDDKYLLSYEERKDLQYKISSLAYKRLISDTDVFSPEI